MSLEILQLFMSAYDMDLLKEERETAHVYVLFCGDQVVYVGMTRNIDARLRTHCVGTKIDRALTLRVPIGDALAMEGALMRRLAPARLPNMPVDTGRDTEMLARVGLEVDESIKTAHVAALKQARVSRKSGRTKRAA